MQTQIALVKRTREVVLRLLVICLVALMGAERASATSPAEASGTAIATSQTITDFRTADGQTFISLTFTQIVTETYTGTSVGEQVVVIHAGGALNIRGTLTCLCTVEDQVGLLVLGFEGTGVVGAFIENHYRILSGKGTLPNVHGEGIFVFDATTGVGTYSGRHHIDP